MQYLTDEEIEIYENLNKDLQEIAQLNGPFKWIRVSSMFIFAGMRIVQTKTVFQMIGLWDIIQAGIVINKLCMLISASESNDMVITDKLL